KPGFAEVFLLDGKAPDEGQIFRNPALAGTYRQLATAGRAAFYDGEIARAIVAFSEAQGGFFSIEDLTRHSSDWVEPQSTSYRGVDLFELPPNGQGIAALEMLNILEGFDLRSMGRESANFWHLMIEAKKLAYEDRARFYADPEFAEVPTGNLISKAYGRTQAKRIDMNRAAERLEPGDPGMARGDTTYLAVADRDGNMVSLIQSNYTGFGSGYVLPQWGFGIQNRGALFNLYPESPNHLKPGKRPFHTIIPAFAMKDGQPWLAFGVMGGDMQPQGHVQILVNMLDLDMNLQEAGDAARFYHTDSSEPTGTLMTAGGVLHLEPEVPDEIRQDLSRRGHRLGPGVDSYGGYQAVARDPQSGVLSGATESRKDGCARGY
ncbi:MAG: gamma-glutamyltransferase, partial [Acidobacteriota bacterium]|nr:gamma-glutamyltransferase [Acidobacteriota bacterium]